LLGFSKVSLSAKSRYLKAWGTQQIEISRIWM
jgi:hypothetical protein